MRDLKPLTTATSVGSGLMGGGGGETLLILHIKEVVYWWRVNATLSDTGADIRSSPGISGDWQ